MADWPMASFNPQRNGYSPTESLPTVGTFSRAWLASQHRDFGVSDGFRDTVYPQLSPVVSNGHVVLCTLQGRVRSYATGTSKVLQWTRQIPAPTGWTDTPIIGTPAADADKVYVSDIYGRLTAINLADGSIAWGPTQITDYGPIQGAMLLSDGLLLFGGADGKFRFVDPADGGEAYAAYNVGYPIIQGAAGDPGVAVVGAMDCKLYAFDTSDGSLAWTSAIFRGAAAFKDYYPVIVGSQVLVRPFMQLPDVGGGIITPIRGIPIDDYVNGDQDALLELYDDEDTQNNYLPNFRRYSLTSGTELPAPIHHYWWHTMNGSPPPPCLNAAGEIVLGAPRPPGLGMDEAVWARLDLSTRKLLGPMRDAAQPTIGGGNPDENMTVSACSNAVIVMHCEEANATETAAWYPATSTWVRISTTYPTQEGWNNTQGGGASVAAISGGFIYHHAHPHTLTCFRRS